MQIWSCHSKNKKKNSKGILLSQDPCSLLQRHFFSWSCLFIFYSTSLPLHMFPSISWIPICLYFKSQHQYFFLLEVHCPSVSHPVDHPTSVFSSTVLCNLCYSTPYSSFVFPGKLLNGRHYAAFISVWLASSTVLSTQRMPWMDRQMCGGSDKSQSLKRGSHSLKHSSFSCSLRTLMIKGLSRQLPKLLLLGHVYFLHSTYHTL